MKKIILLISFIFLLISDSSAETPIRFFKEEIIIELKEKGLGVLLTDHNVRETLSITDRSYLIAEGKILISGAADALINDPQARKIYLGDKFSM